MRVERAVEGVSNAFQEKTRKALLWMNLSHEPFVILYALLPFILRKDLNASILQISILSALRPILPVFSFYWSANLRRNRLRSNLIGAWAFARLPFLLVPWINNVWYLIACCAVYEFFNKSGIPALIEILKINIPKETREASYALFFVLSFLESILLGFVIAWILDLNASIWSTLFGILAFVGLTSVFFQLAVPIPLESSTPLYRNNLKNREIGKEAPQNLDSERATIAREQGASENQDSEVKPTQPKTDSSSCFGIPEATISQRIVQPWKDTFSLLKGHPDFARFQYGFMLGGFSLMLVAPSLSIFYVDYLTLPFSSVVTGRSILMGAGIVISSWFWKRMLIRERVPQLTQWILFGFACYLLLMVCSPLHMGCFYLSFILYGIAQAGSHLLWNLSGILFSADGDSAPFSRLNILMVGLRGAIAPALGGILCNLLGPIPVFVIGIGICFIGMGYMRFAYSPKKIET